jgi:DNA-binding NarL/FixJ family response regulator
MITSKRTFKQPAPKNPAAVRTKKAKVLVVDDHPIVREGLSQVINHESDLTVCGEAESAQRALQVIDSTRPDVVIVDISLERSNGIDLIKDLKSRYPRLLMLVLSTHDESLYAERSLRAGARGYVMKQVAPQKLVGAIRQILKGEIYLSENMTGLLLHKIVSDQPTRGTSPLERLSNRELEIFELIGRGRKTRQIAEDLHLSIKTVETHREHIKEKLSLKDAVSLVRAAVQWVESEKI